MKEKEKFRDVESGFRGSEKLKKNYMQTFAWGDGGKLARTRRRTLVKNEEGGSMKSER